MPTPPPRRPCLPSRRPAYSNPPYQPAARLSHAGTVTLPAAAMGLTVGQQAAACRRWVRVNPNPALGRAAPLLGLAPSTPPPIVRRASPTNPNPTLHRHLRSRVQRTQARPSRSRTLLARRCCSGSTRAPRRADEPPRAWRSKGCSLSSPRRTSPSSAAATTARPQSEPEPEPKPEP